MNAVKKEFFLTAEGLQKLRDELADLTGNQRQQIAARLKEAKEMGDLSENAQYDAARDEQSFVEGRIAEIEHILKHATMIENGHGNGSKGTVDLGSTVHVELEGGSQKYTIVGSTEADPGSGKISNESPIGRAFLGKKAGDEVAVEVPSGTIVYKIKKVE